MKNHLLIIAVSLVLSLYSSLSFALMYDFGSTEAGVLNGLTEETFVVDGIPLQIQAGTMTSVGAFTLGGLGSTMCIDSSGLGVSQNSFCSQLQVDTAGEPEAIVFNFNSLFIPEEIALDKFFEGEDIRIFTDGSLFGDFIGSSSGAKTISLPGGISSLWVTTLGISDDSDYWIASIEGTVVPEPSIMLLLGTGLIGVGFFSKKFRK